MSVNYADELRQLRRRQPFQPFRVHLKNGETYDVLDSFEFLVGDFTFAVTVHHPTDSDKDYPVLSDLDQLVQIEPIAPSPANGRSE